jgi:hypothetical protein
MSMQPGGDYFNIMEVQKSVRNVLRMFGLNHSIELDHSVIVMYVNMPLGNNKYKYAG